MSEPTENLPPKQQAPDQDEPHTVDPEDLVYKGGYQGNPREIVENPAVAPEMINVGQTPSDLRGDLIDEE